jgi:hypothetical protein
MPKGLSDDEQPTFERADSHPITVLRTLRDAGSLRCCGVVCRWLHERSEYAIPDMEYVVPIGGKRRL